MSKVVKLSSVMEREEKLKEEEETHTGKADELIEALDALEDASETIEDVLEN